MSTKITADVLRSKGACQIQLDKFAVLFPTGTRPTAIECKKYALEFDWDWAAANLLTAPAFAEYGRVRDAAYAEYNRVVDAAAAKYNRVVDAAFAEGGRVRDAAYAEYNRVRDAAIAEYNRVSVPAYAECNRVSAQAFCAAWLSMHG